MLALGPTAILLTIICGALVGFMLALTGGGGSTLAVPLLVYVLGMTNAHLAIGTSALAVAINAFANLIAHARAGHVRWRVAGVFTAFGVMGTLAGSELGKRVGGTSLLALFAVLMLVVAGLMARPQRPSSGERQAAPRRLLGLRLSGAGLGAGTLAGFFGIGGGFLIVPGLMVSTSMPAIDAIGTSLFGVGSFGLATAWNYARSGFIDWPVAMIFILGGTAGGWVGAAFAHRLSARQGLLQRLFAAMIAAVAVSMLVHLFMTG